jgi:hypothetical protein
LEVLEWWGDKLDIGWYREIVLSVEEWLEMDGK